MATFTNPFLPMYATPIQIRRVLGTLGQSTNDDDILLDFCQKASRRIDQYCNRFFYPLYKTVLMDWPGNSFTLNFPLDLINLVTFTNGDGNVIPLMSGSTINYYLYEPDLFPKYKLQLSIISGKVFLFVGTPQQAISLYGLYGYPASEYTGQWKELSGATVQNGTSQNSTQGTLMSETGYFNQGDTLYIDDEFQIVQSVSPLNPDSYHDTLGVQRSSCGSTGAIHLNGTAIYKVIYHPDIQDAMFRIASVLYRKKDASQMDNIGVDTMGRLTLPLELPADAKAILNGYRKGHRR